jgi:hypothetical protein
MSTKSDGPKFGPEDAQGFRSFSLYTGDRKVTYKISVHFGALCEGLAKTAGDFNTYSKAEQESIKAAAALLAARLPDEVVTDEITSAQVAKLTLENLLQGVVDFTPRSFEQFFPGLTKRVLQVASDACIKMSLNDVAQGFKVPPVTTEESVSVLLANLVQLLRKLLSQKGRPLETPGLLRDVQTAIRKLKVKPGKRPTQQQVADIMRTQPRTLRQRMATYGIKTWGELLLACKYWEELNSP